MTLTKDVLFGVISKKVVAFLRHKLYYDKGEKLKIRRKGGHFLVRDNDK